MVATKDSASTADNRDRSEGTDVVEVADLGTVRTIRAVVGDVTSVTREENGVTTTAVRQKLRVGAAKVHPVGNAAGSKSRTIASGNCSPHYIIRVSQCVFSYQVQ